MVAFVALICVKISRGRLTHWWVPLNPDGIELNKRLHRMEFLSEKGEDRRGADVEMQEPTPHQGVVAV